MQLHKPTQRVLGGLLLLCCAILAYAGVGLRVQAAVFDPVTGCNLETQYSDGHGNCLPRTWCGAHEGYKGPGEQCSGSAVVVCSDGIEAGYHANGVCPAPTTTRRCTGSGLPGMIIRTGGGWNEQCPAACGDGVVQQGRGEECDPGEDSATGLVKEATACSKSCKWQRSVKLELPKEQATSDLGYPITVIGEGFPSKKEFTALEVPFTSKAVQMIARYTKATAVTQTGPTSYKAILLATFHNLDSKPASYTALVDGQPYKVTVESGCKTLLGTDSIGKARDPHKVVVGLYVANDPTFKIEPYRRYVEEKKLTPLLNVGLKTIEPYASAQKSLIVRYQIVDPIADVSTDSPDPLVGLYRACPADVIVYMDDAVGRSTAYAGKQVVFLQGKGFEEGNVPPLALVHELSHIFGLHDEYAARDVFDTRLEGATNRFLEVLPVFDFLNKAKQVGTNCAVDASRAWWRREFPLHKTLDRMTAWSQEVGEYTGEVGQCFSSEGDPITSCRYVVTPHPGPLAAEVLYVPVADKESCATTAKQEIATRTSFYGPTSRCVYADQALETYMCSESSFLSIAKGEDPQFVPCSTLADSLKYGPLGVYGCDYNHANISPTVNSLMRAGTDQLGEASKAVIARSLGPVNEALLCRSIAASTEQTMAELSPLCATYKDIRFPTSLDEVETPTKEMRMDWSLIPGLPMAGESFDLKLEAFGYTKKDLARSTVFIRGYGENSSSRVLGEVQLANMIGGGQKKYFTQSFPFTIVPIPHETRYDIVLQTVSQESADGESGTPQTRVIGSFTVGQPTVAMVTALQGTVRITPAGQGKSLPVTTATEFHRGDLITTDADSDLILKVFANAETPGGTLSVHGNTMLSLSVVASTPELNKLQVKLDEGVAELETPAPTGKLRDLIRSDFTVTTPTSVSGVRGSALIVTYEKESGETTMFVTEHEGFIRPRGSDKETILKVGEKVLVTKDGVVSTPTPFTKNEVVRAQAGVLSNLKEENATTTPVASEELPDPILEVTGTIATQSLQAKIDSLLGLYFNNGKGIAWKNAAQNSSLRGLGGMPLEIKLPGGSVKVTLRPNSFSEDVKLAVAVKDAQDIEALKDVTSGIPDGYQLVNGNVIEIHATPAVALKKNANISFDFPKKSPFGDWERDSVGVYEFRDLPSPHWQLLHAIGQTQYNDYTGTAEVSIEGKSLNIGTIALFGKKVPPKQEEVPAPEKPAALEQTGALALSTVHSLLANLFCSIPFWGMLCGL